MIRRGLGFGSTPRDIIAYVQEAVQLNESGAVFRKRTNRPNPAMPADVKRLLVRHDLLNAYENRPPYQRRDYLNWILSAKRDETRAKRLDTMLDDLRSGQYMGME